MSQFSQESTPFEAAGSLPVEVRDVAVGSIAVLNAEDLGLCTWDAEGGACPLE
jgi:hypothetical protein